MQKCLKRTPGAIVLMAAVLLLLLLLSAINALENNTALNNTIVENITINNTTLNNSTASGSASSNSAELNAVNNKAGNGSISPSAALPQEVSSSNAALQMGKGLNENVINTSSLNKDGASFSINSGGVNSPFQIGQAEKPVKDLETIVFVCDIV